MAVLPPAIPVIAGVAGGSLAAMNSLRTAPHSRLAASI